VKRGEIWTQSGGPGYAEKPRPALIVQSDLLEGTDSVITCLFTTQNDKDMPTRLRFDPDADNGLLESSVLMTDKIMAVDRTKLGRRIGAVSAEDIGRVEEAMLLVLGFAG
jgi:mRNA interferase MazF